MVALNVDSSHHIPFCMFNGVGVWQHAGTMPQAYAGHNIAAYHLDVACMTHVMFVIFEQWGSEPGSVAAGRAASQGI